MKNTIQLMVIFLGLISCTGNTPTINSPSVGGASKNIHYEEFKYKGHDMVEFKDVNVYGSSIIHSPECKKCYQIYD